MNSFGDDGNLGAIHNALLNWQNVWELYLQQHSSSPPHVMVECNSPTLLPQDMWKRVGFMRHAYEFWLLANLITERMTRKSTPDFVLDFDSAEFGATVEPVLNKFDQNNMRQVNELIASFQQARLL